MLAQSSIDADAGGRWEAAMADGDFEAAWRVSDQVLAARDPARRDDPDLPYHLRWVWDGRPFGGRDVLVRCYHGLGDTIQFCRYLAPLAARAASVTVEAQPELVPLLALLPGGSRLIPFRQDAPAPPAAVDLEIMELAHALRLRPDPAPYLHLRTAASPPGSTRWPLCVGICWQAGAWLPERSLPLAALGPLAAIPGVELHSLQRGPASADLLAPGAPPVANPADTSTDILATARAILGLDLVVTVDTMVAHLAGALGVPTRLLLMHTPDWRWRAGGDGSAWYGSVRKYRQHVPGDWTAPIAELARDVQALMMGGGTGGTPQDDRGL